MRRPVHPAGERRPAFTHPSSPRLWFSSACRPGRPHSTATGFSGSGEAILAGDRVVKRKAKGVKGDSTEGVGFGTIFLIANDWSAHVRQVHANLVLAAGIELDFNQ